ncbi:MAG: TPM domain-containing protein, partial [Bacteroidales bacterium]|nr:TPM domain-containing protein [Bacteroidales bacterium]
MKKLLFLFSIPLLSLSIFSQQDLPKRPEPPRLVNDLAQLFTQQQSYDLEQMLRAFNDTTSTQISVVTVSSLNDYTIEEFTDQLAEQWGVGRKGKDNGVMVLIKPKLNDREKGYARISVGYGLEGAIPDV